MKTHHATGSGDTHTHHTHGDTHHTHGDTRYPSYPCDICGMAFTTKNDLNKHMMIIHNHNNYIDNCIDQISLLSQMQTHIDGAVSAVSFAQKIHTFTHEDDNVTHEDNVTKNEDSAATNKDSMITHKDSHDYAVPIKKQTVTHEDDENTHENDITHDDDTSTHEDNSNTHEDDSDTIKT